MIQKNGPRQFGNRRVNQTPFGEQRSKPPTFKKMFRPSKDLDSFLTTLEQLKSLADTTEGEKLAGILSISKLEDGRTVKLVTQHSGTALKYFKDSRSLSFRDCLDITSKTLKTAHFLHTNGLVHGDIHGGNILLSKDADQLNVKLCDFDRVEPVDSEGLLIKREKDSIHENCLLPMLQSGLWYDSEAEYELACNLDGLFSRPMSLPELAHAVDEILKDLPMDGEMNFNRSWSCQIIDPFDLI